MTRLSAIFEELCERLMTESPEVVGPDEAPSRLHGDLWSSNLLWAPDPADIRASGSSIQRHTAVIESRTWRCCCCLVRRSWNGSSAHTTRPHHWPTDGSPRFVASGVPVARAHDSVRRRLHGQALMAARRALGLAD